MEGRCDCEPKVKDCRGIAQVVRTVDEILTRTQGELTTIMGILDKNIKLPVNETTECLDLSSFVRKVEFIAGNCELLANKISEELVYDA